MSKNNLPLMVFAFLIVQLLSVPSVKAIEVLTAQKLSAHCALFSSEPKSVDGQYCVLYIQGFIDGAIATDARVKLNAESALSEKETFTERAIRTRMPNRLDSSKATDRAVFCLGKTLPLRDIVNVIVADLAAQADSNEENELAKKAVYKSLRKNYPCKL